jgi:hypothetical protein
MKKFTLVIGSGIHKQFLPDEREEFAPLKSWDSLLQSMNISGYNSPLLGFEKKICENASKKFLAAKDAEKELLKELSLTIKPIQEKILSDKSLKYPLEIFNPKKVGNVIILNFDLVIEKLLAKAGNFKDTKVKGKTSGGIRYREINGIKFWHPHGDIEYPSEIQFGLRKYGYNIQGVELLRGSYKKDEVIAEYNNESIETTWLSTLINDPLIFLGTGMGMEEWTLWYALTTRQRNYARKGKLEPVYTLNKSDAYCTMQSFLQVKAISDSRDYDTAWGELVKFLS